MDYFRALIGILSLVGIAYLFSTNKKSVDWKLVGTGILLQIIIALLIAKVPVLKSAFEVISAGFVKFQLW